MRFIISIQQFGNTSVGSFWRRWTRVNKISIYSKCFIYMTRWRISEKSVISCNKVKTFFLSAKTAEDRKLATKQQKRCFEWDKAKMTQLAANRPKSQFQTKKAKNNIKKSKQAKKRFYLAIKLKTVWSAAIRQKPFSSAKKSWKQRHLPTKHQKRCFE